MNENEVKNTDQTNSDFNMDSERGPEFNAVENFKWDDVLSGGVGMAMLVSLSV